jgi:hypothetical protein
MLEDIWLLSLALGFVSVPGLYVAHNKLRRAAAKEACPTVTTPVADEKHQSEY